MYVHQFMHRRRQAKLSSSPLIQARKDLCPDSLVDGGTPGATTRNVSIAPGPQSPAPATG